MEAFWEFMGWLFRASFVTTLISGWICLTSWLIALLGEFFSGG